MLKGLFDFFSPEQTKQQQTKQQTRQNGQQQTKQVSQQQQQVADFVPQGKMQQLPPLKETSSLFQPKQSLQTSDQLTQQIVRQADKQTQQSRQRLQQLKKDGLSPKKILQAEQAHQQILRNARQIKSLLADITQAMQMNRVKQQQHRRIKQQQTQQNKRVLKKMENESEQLITELRTVLQQMMVARQQTRRSQLAHIRQLQQVKTNLLQQQVMNKKTVQYDTPQGNKVRIQLSVRPDSKCCVAQSLAQKTRVLYRPRQQTVLV